MRRISSLAILLALVLPVTPGAAQDALTVGTGVAPSSGSVNIPVSIRDLSGTPLGSDAGTGNRIQGFAFKVFYPTDVVSSVSFTRAGVAASATPLFETTLQGSGWISYVVSFQESTDPLPFTLNAAAPGNQIGTLTVAPLADLPQGTTAVITLHPPSAMLSNQAGSVSETVASGHLAVVNGSVTVNGFLAAPSGVVATAVSSSAVMVSWTAVTGAIHYEVWRSSAGGSFTLAGSPTGTTFNDSPVSADTTHIYRVRTGTTSPFSNIDVATTVIFTDDPLGAQTTRIKAIHVTELRTAVNAMRAAATLPPLGTDPTVAVGAVVRATHITALRTGLADARTVLGLPPLSFTDTLTPAVTPVKALHLQEIRNGVK